jgi:hypothetical protein
MKDAGLNRFNGLFGAEETVETVMELFPDVSTPLKWGVNESCPHSKIDPQARSRQKFRVLNENCAYFLHDSTG